MTTNQPQPHWDGTQWVYRNADGTPYDPFTPATAPKKSNKKGWTIAITIIATFLFFGSCNAILTDSDEDTARSTQTINYSGVPTARPAPAVPAPVAPAPARNAIGVPVADGKFTFTVQAVREGGAVLGDNPYLQTTAQGRYVLVDMLVANTGDRAQSYFSDSQKLIDEQGRQYEADSMADINLDQQIMTDINPGNSVRVTLAFDIPNGAVPTTLEVHDSIFSGGADVALK